MSIGRRFFLQTGASACLSAMVHGCGQVQNRPTLPISQRLLDQIQKRGYLLVITKEEYSPYNFLINGKPTGLCYKLLDRLKQRVPFEIRYEILPPQDVPQALASGKYDAAITAVGITEERAKLFDFTMPISEATIAYIKRKGDPSIHTLYDLSGKILGAQEGGFSLAVVPNLATKLKEKGGKLGSVKQYRHCSEAYQDLIAQRLDAVLHNIVSLSVLVDEKPAIFELGERVSPRSYAAWAVKKGNHDLLTLLNHFLADLRQQGELKRLQEKWLKLSFDQLPTEPRLPGDRTLSSASLKTPLIF